MDSDVTKILFDILLVIISGALTIGAYYARKKWGGPALADITTKIEAVVKAAEVMGAEFGWDSTEKKTWAINKAVELTGLTYEEIDAFVEAAVHQLKITWSELSTSPTTGEVVTKLEAVREVEALDQEPAEEG